MSYNEWQMVVRDELEILGYNRYMYLDEQVMYNHWEAGREPEDVVNDIVYG